LSFTPEEIAAEIKKVIPNFAISYEPDFRQQIAESWPQVIDDKEAKAEWGWQSSYTLKDISETMILKLREQLTFA
jgi:nucleoside-diphosphate-sugar epimerase